VFGLIGTARSLAAQGNHEEARELCRTEEASFAVPPEAEADPRTVGSGPYNMACCLAVAGARDAAFGYLRKAVAAGFRDAAWAEQDPDLESLRSDRRWQRLIEQMSGDE